MCHGLPARPPADSISTLSDPSQYQALVALESGLCVTIKRTSSGGDGAPLLLAPCADDSPTQAFNVDLQAFSGSPLASAGYTP